MNTAKRTNIYISDDCRAILSALGAATSGRPSLAAGLSELISRTIDGITAYPVKPGDKHTQYKAYWLHPGQVDVSGYARTAAEQEQVNTQFTEYAYPSRAEATAAAVLLRYEAERARALAQPEKVQP